MDCCPTLPAPSLSCGYINLADAVRKHRVTGGVDFVINNLVFVATRDGRVHIYREDSPDKPTPVQGS
jgi:hypothetical protein